MKIITHNIKNLKVAEIVTDSVILSTTEDGLELMGNLYYQGFDKIIIHEKNLNPSFFILSNGISGSILQKFAQYGVALAIIGDFSTYKSRSLSDFIYESNKGNHINFVDSVSAALHSVTS